MSNLVEESVFDVSEDPVRGRGLRAKRPYSQCMDLHLYIGIYK